MAVAIVSFNVGGGTAVRPEHGSGSRTWLGGADVHFHVGMDGLSLFMVLADRGGDRRRDRGRRSGPVATASRSTSALLLLLEAALVLLFTARDLVLFYVGWEVMMIPLFVLMGVWGGERRRCATLQFVVYTLVGSLLMLVAIAALGGRGRTRSS